MIRSRDLNAVLNLCHYPEMQRDAGLTSVEPHSSSGRTSDTAQPAAASRNGGPAELIGWSSAGRSARGTLNFDERRALAADAGNCGVKLFSETREGNEVSIF